MTNPSTRIESTLGGTSEREMIVAWLRRQNGEIDSPFYGDNCDGLADAIERGDHLKSPGEQPSMIVGWGANIPPEFQRP